MSGLNREELIEAGWARGAFVELHAYPAILDELPKKLRDFCVSQETVFLIPVLYDCALIDLRFDKEPWVQVVIGSVCDENPSYRHARNPRLLHLPIGCKSDGNLKCIEISALGFAQIDREFLLLNSVPSSEYQWSEASLECLLNWIAERYRQATFPDSFNKKVEQKQKLLKKAWKSQPFVEYCSGVHIRIFPDVELPEQEEYDVDILLTIPSIYKKRELAEIVRDSAPAMKEIIRNIFNSIVGVKNVRVETIPENQFTKEQERMYKKYSLEYYSFSSDNVDAVLPADFFIQGA
ncbi:hypothetical protein R4P48_23145 [Atlantibacter subterranea]|uniref:Uncharacterized protein n=1 Tax=Atlantibacter subterraneus TaxID=255519 RepID=A0ABU4EBH2_9ENTR|nr:hypothetical protein [Atlantibacter subterranea]MDV7025546.1 hypothetical protein [Atlantibacter subterranea]MDZ5668733.1 hypothetical protein [Atlantibacter hermannii]